MAQVDQSVMPAYRAAYASTIRCFAANGLLLDDYEKAHDVANAAAHDRKAREAFDLAFKAGEKIGLSDQRVQHDLDAAKVTELPRMVRDKNYFASAVAECKALALM